jgi:AbrB family looped-hinge helix DNA binding protein
MVKEKADIIAVSSKGQVVIPQEIRRKLGITHKNKMLVYCYKDAVILKKIKVPDIEKKLREMYRRIDRRIAKYGELTQEEIEEEIQKYRS